MERDLGNTCSLTLLVFDEETKAKKRTLPRVNPQPKVTTESLVLAFCYALILF